MSCSNFLLLRTVGGNIPPSDQLPKIMLLYWFESCLCSKMYFYLFPHKNYIQFLLSVVPFYFSTPCQAAQLAKKATHKAEQR